MAVDVRICSIVNCCHKMYRPSIDLLVEMNMCMRILPLTMNSHEFACWWACMQGCSYPSIASNSLTAPFGLSEFILSENFMVKPSGNFFNSSGAGMVHSIIHFSFTQLRENRVFRYAVLSFHLYQLVLQ